MLSPDQARSVSEMLIERGIAAGATAADALYVGERSSSVQVRLGNLEDVGRSEGEKVGLRLFAGQRSATVASSDLSDEALGVLVDRCLAMAREAPEDPYAGLAPADLLQRGDLPNVDGDDPAEPDPPPFARERSRPKMRRLPSAESPIRAAPAPARRRRRSLWRPRAGFPGLTGRPATAAPPPSSPAKARGCSAIMPGTARGIWPTSKPLRRSAAKPGTGRGPARPDPPEARPISRTVRPAGLRDAPRPFRGSHQRLFGRDADELPPGQARRAGVRPPGHHHRRSLEAAGPAFTAVRRRGRARFAAGAGLGRYPQQLDRRERVGAAARHRTDRTRGSGRRRKPERKP